MANPLRFALIVAFTALLVAACGNKGPLVMPSPKPSSAPQQPDQPDKPKDSSDKPGSSP
jgi:predicted small lipoprotein YifL